MESSSTPVAERTDPVHRFAGAALAALDRVADAPGWAMTPAEQAEALVELERLRARVTELEWRVLAAADRNEIGAKDGSTSTAAWLANHTRQDRTRCHAAVRGAVLLDEDRYAVTREAFAAGRLTEDQVGVILRAVEDLPAGEVTDADRRRAQQHLVDLAAEHDAKGLRVLGRRLFEVLAPDEADRREAAALERAERRARERCRFAMRDNGDGTHAGWFTLPTLAAQMLTKAVQALAAPRRTDPAAWVDAEGRRRPYACLLGQAFAELVEHLPVDRLPKHGGMAAGVLVKIDYEQLRSGLGAGILDTGDRVSATEVLRLACTSGLMPAVFGTKPVPLHLGRRARLHSEGQRIAMDLRDGGCTTVGCDRPAAWCEAHHDEAWAEGGQTDIDTGRLLCPRHHHLAHDSRYEMQHLPDHKVAFRRRT